MFELKLENSNANIVDLNDGERYEVINASGFNPPSASLFTSKSPNKKGLKHNGSTLNERVVVIQIKLLGNVEESRNALYAWTEPEQYAKIYFKNGAKSVYCEGYVQTCEVDMFSNNEVLNVEILCGDPYLKDMNDIIVSVATYLKQFIFPFAIEHSSTVSVKSKNLYIEDGKEVMRENSSVLMNRGIPFSTLKDNNITNVMNAGAETGVQFVIRFTDTISKLLIYDADNTARKFEINYQFEAGWQVIIDTDASPKTCKAIKPDGTAVNILRYVKGNPTWFTLKRGYNRFGYVANDGTAAVDMTIGFTNKFLGI